MSTAGPALTLSSLANSTHHSSQSDLCLQQQQQHQAREVQRQAREAPPHQSHHHAQHQQPVAWADSQGGIVAAPIPAARGLPCSINGGFVYPRDAWGMRCTATASRSLRVWRESVDSLSAVSSSCARSSRLPVGGTHAPGHLPANPHRHSCLHSSKHRPRGDSLFVPHVPHVRQLYNWDCGLACVLMVLQSAAPQAASLIDLAILRQCSGTTSIWTIDLAHLLRRFGADVAMTTTMVGTNPEYSSEAFYAENLLEDERRIHRLFMDAPRVGIPVYEQSLSPTEVKQAVSSGRYLVIALVDKTVLGPSYTIPIAKPLSDLPGEVAYIGHYIVVCGYCPRTDRYAIRDPAAASCHLSIGSATFEKARHVFGTDDDLLLIAVPPAKGKMRGGVDFARVSAAVAAF